MHLKPLPLIIAIIVLILVGAGVWYFVFRAGPPASMEPNTPAETPVDVTSHIQENGQYSEIDAAYPSQTALKASAGAAADASASAVMKAFAQQEIADFKKNSGLATLTPEDIKMWGLGVDRKFSLQITYQAYVSSATRSYVFAMYEDTLGAHPNGYYRTFVFNSKTGAALALSDLFVPGSKYLTVLSDTSRAKLKASLGADADVDYLNSGTTPEADSFQNTYLDGSDLVIVFPPYQVGPYAIGTQTVRIPRTELSAVLKAEYR